MRKRAEDEAELQKALGVDQGAASEILDGVAQENPEAVMPAEAQAPEAGPEQAMDDGKEAMAAKIIEELKQMGVSDEEIEAAINSVDAEGAAGQAAAAGDEATAKQAAEYCIGMDKSAAEAGCLDRFAYLKNVVRSFRAS
jgi:Holliday junction resolvasome RuvABC DNA-binding subunit